MINWINIGGQKRNGKDTIGNYLKTRYRLVHINYADKIKEIACDLLGVNKEKLEELKLQPKVRQLLVDIGESGRKYNPDMWVNYLQRCLNPSYFYLTTDLRHDNEAKKAKSKGALTVLVIRPGFINNDNVDSEKQIGYWYSYLAAVGINEGDIPKHLHCPYDVFIRNDGDKEALFKKVEFYIEPKLKVAAWYG